MDCSDIITVERKRERGSCGLVTSLNLVVSSTQKFSQMALKVFKNK